MSSKPKTFDWTIATTGSEGAVIQNLMRGLYEFDSNRAPKPDLAKSAEWDASSKILTLTLKTGVIWSDGRPLKCQHFYDSFQRLLSPGLNSPNASLLFDLERARDYFLGKEKNFAAVGVRCEKDDRLVLKLREPRSNLPSILTHGPTFPYRKDRPELTLGDYQWTDRSALLLKKSTSTGTGPDRVQFVVVPDGSHALLDYESGKLQYLLQVEDDLLNAGVLKTPGLGFVDPLRVVALLLVNPSRSATNSAETRRAILSRLATDALISSSPNARVKATSLIPSGISGGPPSGSNEGLHFEGTIGKPPEEALTLGYPNDALSKSIAQTLQEKSTGLKLKIESLASGNPQRYDLILSLFGLDYLDADQLLASFLSQGTLDLFNFSSAELLHLIQKARATQNEDERGKLYAQAAQYLQDRAAIAAPLFYRRRAFALDPRYEFDRGSAGSAIFSRLHSKR